MLKRILAGLLAAVLCAAPALAEVYIGTSVAGRSLSALAGSSAAVQAVYVQAGSSVKTGDLLASLRTTRVFAAQNGTIARIHAHENRDVSGTVLELQPVSRYDIYCTVEDAYGSPENKLVHIGEEIYARCTINGTHQGTAVITAIDGETYMAETTGGEFYNGETVYLYRDPDYDYGTLVGVGTVVGAATQIYEAEGKITRLHVEEGEYVERGELLYEIIEGESTEITAPADGIITSCSLQEGASIQEGQAAFTIAPYEHIRIEIQVEEEMAAAMCIGDSAAMTYACDAQEQLVPGKISEISQIAENGLYTVTITPETPPPYIGMTVNVRLG